MGFEPTTHRLLVIGYFVLPTDFILSPARTLANTVFPFLFREKKRKYEVGGITKCQWVVLYNQLTLGRVFESHRLHVSANSPRKKVKKKCQSFAFGKCEQKGSQSDREQESDWKREGIGTGWSFSTFGGWGHEPPGRRLTRPRRTRVREKRSPHYRLSRSKGIYYFQVPQQYVVESYMI